MSGFTHSDDGTDEARWAEAFASRSDELPRIADDEFADVAHVIVVAAHPDDETLGAAGLLARAYAAGVRTTVIVATSGEASHPASPTHRPAELAPLRERETTASVASIDPGATVEFLRAPDGDLGGHRDLLVQAILAAIRGSSAGGVDRDAHAAHPDDGTAGDVTAGAAPGATWIASPWSGDRHPDHEAAADATAEAVRLALAETPGASIRNLAYPVWLWHWADPCGDDVPWGDVVLLPLDDATVDAKGRALALHASQVEPLSERSGDEVLLSSRMLAHFGRPYETFVTTPVAAPSSPSGSGHSPAAGRTPHNAEGYFDAVHASADDPWGFESRWYEERRRAILLATLPRRRYREVLEVGTSTGVLSRELAQRASGRFVGVDVSAVAVERARERNRDLAHARFERMTVPAEWPEGSFDLVVVSEIGYYLDAPEVDALLVRIADALSGDGVVVFCHWRHDVADRELRGDDVHAMLERRPEFARLTRHIEEDFVLDVVVRPPAVSVAAEEGIV